MYDFATDETRIYAPAEDADVATEGFPQITIADTGWTENEREQMRVHGFDRMDTLRAWLD